MNRPYIVSLQCINNGKDLKISLSVTNVKTPVINSDSVEAIAPIKSIRLITSKEFSVNLCVLDNEKKNIFTKEYQTDSFGNIDITIPLNKINGIKYIEVYETSTMPGVHYLLGTYLPLKLESYKKVVISDFDKTLLDTKFSTLTEMISSLKSPLSNFPPIESSIDQVKELIKEGYAPFVLSASPHFYEHAIQKWLYSQQIYTSNIYLKDYRNVLSFTEGILTPKDMKSQGFYKLGQLVKILLMTDGADELVLFGDGFESDSYIYLILHALLVKKVEPWSIWNEIKKQKSFRLSDKQSSVFLSSFYQLGQLMKKRKIKLTINIRCNEKNFKEASNKKFPATFIDSPKEIINFYLA